MAAGLGISRQNLNHNGPLMFPFRQLTFCRKKQAVKAIFSAKDYVFKPQWIVEKAKSFMLALIAALRLANFPSTSP